jgi:hypothetical protein
MCKRNCALSTLVLNRISFSYSSVYIFLQLATCYGLHSSHNMWLSSKHFVLLVNLWRTEIPFYLILCCSFYWAGPKGRKHGSPVRIFTNASPKDIPLPKEEGYRYCSICLRWVSEENRHCTQCNVCSSKVIYMYGVV